MIIHTQKEAERLLSSYPDKVAKLLGGTSYSKKILCPFHADKQPSLKLYTNGQRIVGYCFGCKKQYSVFEIYAKQHDMDEETAVQELLSQFGIEYVPIERFEKYHEAIECAHERLVTYELNNAAMEFLSKKGIELATALKYGLCQLKENVDKSSVLKSVSMEFQIPYVFLENTFTPIVPNRLIYPIKNEDGKIVAYASRALQNTNPKYVNSKTTCLYSKAKFLYGLDVVKKANRQMLFLVEGYNDALAMWQYGFYNTVAVAGTALTKQMVERLKNLGYKEFVLIFDPDKAGIMAALNSVIEIFVPLGIDVQIRLLPDNVDVDDYLNIKKIPTAINELSVVDVSLILCKVIQSKEMLLEIFKSAPLEYAERILLQSEVDPATKYELLYEVFKNAYVNLKNNIIDIVKG